MVLLELVPLIIATILIVRVGKIEQKTFQLWRDGRLTGAHAPQEFQLAPEVAPELSGKPDWYRESTDGFDADDGETIFKDQ